LCRIAPRVSKIWGFDEDDKLLATTKQRVVSTGVTNATLVLGNVAVTSDVIKLPESTFDIVLSRRGPNVTKDLVRSLKPNAIIIQELVKGTLGLNPLFGRQAYLPTVLPNPHCLVDDYQNLGFLPVSVKDYFFKVFYRDAAHLLGDISNLLGSDWRMPDKPYEEARDRAAFDLYVRYNTTPQGVRVIHHHSIYLFQREDIIYYPAVPDARRKYES